jgi:hypothetical protein
MLLLRAFGISAFISASVSLLAQPGNIAAAESCSVPSDHVMSQLASLADALGSSAARDKLTTEVDKLEIAIRETQTCKASGQVDLPPAAKSPNPQVSGVARPSPGDLMSRLDRTHRSVPTREEETQVNLSEGLRMFRDELRKPVLNYPALKSLLGRLRSSP